MTEEEKEAEGLITEDEEENNTQEKIPPLPTLEEHHTLKTKIEKDGQEKIFAEAVRILQKEASRIIGRGGGVINRIRAESNADLTINDPVPGHKYQEMFIEGTAQEVEKAKHLIKEVLNSRRDPPPPQYPQPYYPQWPQHPQPYYRPQ
jgi:hypothetical protein